MREIGHSSPNGKDGESSGVEMLRAVSPVLWIPTVFGECRKVGSGQDMRALPKLLTFDTEAKEDRCSRAHDPAKLSDFSQLAVGTGIDLSSIANHVPLNAVHTVQLSKLSYSNGVLFRP